MDNAEEQKRIKGNTVAYGIKIQVSVSNLPITEVMYPNQIRIHFTSGGSIKVFVPFGMSRTYH